MVWYEGRVFEVMVVGSPMTLAVIGLLEEDPYFD